MQLVNEFEVGAPVEHAWAVLSDVRTVVTCVPGAEIVGASGDDYDGQVTIKVGPVSMRLAGVVTVLERDDDEHQLAVRGSAKDLRGQGGVEAVIRLRATATGDARTRVDLLTDLDLSGPAGQLGAGMVRQVNKRLLAQFAERLGTALEVEAGDPDLRGSEPILPAAAWAAPPGGWTAWTRHPLAREIAPVIIGGILLGRALARATRRVAA